MSIYTLFTPDSTLSRQLCSQPRTSKSSVSHHHLILPAPFLLHVACIVFEPLFQGDSLSTQTHRPYLHLYLVMDWQVWWHLLILATVSGVSRTSFSLGELWNLRFHWVPRSGVGRGRKLTFINVRSLERWCGWVVESVGVRLHLASPWPSWAILGSDLVLWTSISHPEKKGKIVVSAPIWWFWRSNGDYKFKVW